MSHVLARQIGRLTTDEITNALTSASVLCLPIGSYEQHGPHLPLHTDTVIAEQFTTRLVHQYGDSHDLWMMPTIPYGLSPEHDWAPGTITLPIRVLTDLIDATCGEYVRSTPARNLLIVNGHGGNRGILEAVIYDLHRRHDVNVCVIHPSSLATVRADSELPEVHAGLRETSVMLALAPDDVHLERLPDSYEPDPDHAEGTRRLVLDRGTTWPWNSDNPAMSQLGIIGGNARRATAELGEQIIASALDRCPDILARLNKPDP
ncbi:creatininase family protein [Paractinoplanes hotanensis]|uniref:Creatininase family protein n=1 Tax=Paractinoplanes hotanensis TaxID=2906497 RepID=A0ABT0YET1_9ACTN|nr:creatininase family protein [Actinoplanes hotanensis]MCM4084549.1 creatininase family protein [Actinoplanes hotanensis]